MYIYIYKFVKSCIGENVCDVTYATTCTDLVHHYISDGSDNLRKLLKVPISIRVPLQV